MKANIYMFYSFLVAVLLTAAQTVWKMAFNKIGEITFSLNDFHKFFNPFILTGIVLYIIATFLWFKVLHALPLSIAYPILSISYVFGYFIGITVFKESFSFVSLIGVLLIMTGVSLLAYNVK
mgnify:CR=1 FL=1|jgi:multidrug transporter EmrE-like cation transporter